MSSKSPIQQLEVLVKECMDEDAIWLLHVMNKDEERYKSREDIGDLDRKLTKTNINFLNSIKDLKEIKTHIINVYSNRSDTTILDYIDDLVDFRATLKNRNRDLKKYLKNLRLLSFALKILLDKIKQRNNLFHEIDNNYFLFLYLIFIYPDQFEITEALDLIEKNFSQMLLNNGAHFKKEDSSEFYIWAKKYMDGHPSYQSKQYTPMSPEEYKTTVNIIFDYLLYDNQHIYDALKDKLNNAWYQKKYRQKNKGIKPHYFVLTANTRKCLHVLAVKNGMSEDKIIELLINERYVQQCTNALGEDIYMPF